MIYQFLKQILLLHRFSVKKTHNFEYALIIEHFLTQAISLGHRAYRVQYWQGPLESLPCDRICIVPAFSHCQLGQGS